MDDADSPEFLIFIYGGGFHHKDNKSKCGERLKVPADAPPALFLLAHDDKLNPVEAAMLYLKYKKQNLSVGLHICAKGCHGFGMRKDVHAINDWPQRCIE